LNEGLAKVLGNAHNALDTSLPMTLPSSFTATSPALAADADMAPLVGAPGAGCTHRLADVATIARNALGTLVNAVQRSDAIPPRTHGVGALFQHLRGARMQT